MKNVEMHRLAELILCHSLCNVLFRLINCHCLQSPFLQQFFVWSIKYRGSNDRVWFVHVPHLNVPWNNIPFLPSTRLPRLITRVQDPISAVTNVDDYSGSARLLAATTLRNVLGTRNLGDILSDRESIAQEMQVIDPFNPISEIEKEL